MQKPSAHSQHPTPVQGSAVERKPTQNEELDDVSDAASSQFPDQEPASKMPEAVNEAGTNQWVTGKDIQILELDSRNPVVSYGDQIYSCTWSDLIGTNLFFSGPDDLPLSDDLSTHDKYNFLGTSRIKLVGHRARVTQKPGTKKRGRPRNENDIEEISIDEDEILTPGKSLGNLRYSNAKVNADIKRQARFLEKLMNVKRAKGDTDHVRTIVTRDMATAYNRARKASKAGNMHKPAVNEEMERLNRRILRGDTEALTRLQQLYSSLEQESVQEPLNFPEEVSAPDPQPDQISRTP